MKATRSICVTVIACITSATAAAATVRYVNVNNANPNPPYTTWATAATVIQDAIDVAMAGDEIVVTDGVYQSGGRPVPGSSLTNRVVVDRPLTLRSLNGPGVTVIRGYQVPGTTNGPVAIRCVYLAGGGTLSGFTLNFGATRTNGDFLLDRTGGGVWCESGTAIISNCVIVRNAAYSAGGGAYAGTLNNCTLSGNFAYDAGGAYYSTLKSCTLIANVAGNDAGGAYGGTLNDCSLSGNSAEWGGGVAFATLTNCTLDGNAAQYRGGGVEGGSVNNCTLTNNHALIGGGAFYATLNNSMLNGNTALKAGGGADSSVLNNCTLNGNTADYSGGGANSCTLTNCTVSGNSASMGGGDFASSLNNCILSSNSARSGASEIWAAGRGGGACMSVLNNCVLTDNSAWIGGGASGGTLNNCVLTRNRAQTGGGASGNDYFGVLGLSGGDLMYVPVWEPAFLNNCTLAGNTAEFGGGTFACGANNCIIYHNTATNGPNWYEYENITFSHWYGPEIVTFSSCCTTPMPTNGVGNFTNAPLFVDPGNGAFRLQPDSPCINAGENNYVTTSTDLAGNQRISGSTVDVGAYEFVFTPAMLAGQLILEVEKTNLGDKNKQPLLAALLAALSSFDRGDTSAALNQLSAFQNKVREQVAPRNSALAAEWTAAVRQIIAAASGH